MAQEVDMKKISFGIKSSLSVAVKAQSGAILNSDNRRDDIVISSSRQQDLEEPPCVGRDE